MTMTDEEILSAAARLHAARRRQFAKHCPVCGTAFEGIARRRYCSAACRVRAARSSNGVETPMPSSEAENPSMSARTRVAQRGGRSHQVLGAAPEAGGTASAANAVDADPLVPPQQDGDSIGDYLERVSISIMGDRIAEERSEDIVRRERDWLTDEIIRRMTS